MLNGTFQDWPRFWGQFCEAIDKSSIAGVTKFSYLRELLAPKVRASIEALPFTKRSVLSAKQYLVLRNKLSLLFFHFCPSYLYLEKL